MASFNKIILMGHLGQDPELKKSHSGISVCSISLGVNRAYKDQSGEVKCDFFTVVFWRQQAEVVCKYLKKGAPVLVFGHLETRSWSDTQGNKRYTTEVISDEVTLISANSTKNDSLPFPENGITSGGSSTGGRYPVPSFNSAEQVRFEEIPQDSDLPF